MSRFGSFLALISFVFIAVMVLLGSYRAQAVTKTFTPNGPSSIIDPSYCQAGSLLLTQGYFWENTECWTSTGVPASTDQVIIDFSDAGFTDATIQMIGASVTRSATTDFQRDGSNSNITVSASTTFTNNSTLNTEVDLTNDGTFNNTGLIRNGYDNSALIKESGDGFIDNNNIFTNSGTIENYALFTNDGTFTQTAGLFNNRAEAITLYDPVFINNGTFNLNGGRFENRANGDGVDAGFQHNTGTITIGAGGTFENYTLSTFESLSRIINNGTFVLSGGSFNNSELFDNNATFTQTGGVFNNQDIVGINTAVLNDGSFTISGGTFNNNSDGGAFGASFIEGFENRGNLFIDTGGTFNNTERFLNRNFVTNDGTITNTLIFRNRGTIVNTGVFNQNGGAFNNEQIGSVLFNNGTFNLNSGVFNNEKNLFNIVPNHAVLINNGNFNIVGGVFNNYSPGNGTNLGFEHQTGTMTIGAGGTFYNSGRFLSNSTVANSGVFQTDAGGSFELGLSGSFNNFNQFQVISSNFQNFGTFTNSSNVTGTNSNFSNNGIFNNNFGFSTTASNFDNGLTLNNTGTFDIASIFNLGTINNSGTMGVNSIINSGGLLKNMNSFDAIAIFNSGTINNSGAMTANTSITNSGGLFENTGSLVVANLTVGTALNPGIFRNLGSSSLLQVTGTTTIATSDQFLNQGTVENSGFFNNSGVVSNEGTWTAFSTSTLLNQGVFNQSAGSILIASDVVTLSGSDIIESGFLNKGTVHFSGGTFTQESNGSGTVIVNDSSGVVIQTNDHVANIKGNGGGPAGLGFLNAGEWTINDRAVLLLDNTHLFTFNNSGILVNNSNGSGIGGYGLIIRNLSSVNSGFIDNSGRMFVNTHFSNDGLINNGGVITSTGTFNMNAGSVYTGTGTFEGDMLNIEGALGRNVGLDEMVFDGGSVTFNGGAINLQITDLFNHEWIRGTSDFNLNTAVLNLVFDSLFSGNVGDVITLIDVNSLLGGFQFASISHNYAGANLISYQYDQALGTFAITFEESPTAVPSPNIIGLMMIILGLMVWALKRRA